MRRNENLMPKAHIPKSESANTDVPLAGEEFPATDQYMMFGRIAMLRLRAAREKRQKDEDAIRDNHLSLFERMAKVPAPIAADDEDEGILPEEDDKSSP